MPQPKRHDADPMQATLFDALRAAKPHLSLTHLSRRFVARGMHGSDTLMSALMTGETGATGAELFLILEVYGLETAVECLARLAGRALAPKAEARGTLLGTGGELATHLGGFLGALAVAMADGRIDADEASTLLPMVEGIEKLAVRLRDLARRAVSEGA